jgi:hypothetical protein
MRLESGGCLLSATSTTISYEPGVEGEEKHRTYFVRFLVDLKKLDEWDIFIRKATDDRL